MTKQAQKTRHEVAPAPNGEEKKLALAADFGKVYIRVRGDMILKPIKSEMTLYERLGHIYRQQDKYLITATGYKHLNKVASVSVVSPQRVIVDGVAQPNPHVERNPKTKAIETVNLRKVGIGYSPAGNIVVIDKTLFYNVYTYFIQSIQSKMKRVKWVGGKKTDEKEYPDCAVYGIETKKPEKKGSWAFFATEPPLGIWVNYEDQGIIDCLEEHTQRQRFGDRIATTIVERNILKDHPAIAVAQVFQKESKDIGMYAHVTVYGYRHEMEPGNIAEILNQAGMGAEAADFEVESEIIDKADIEEEKAAMTEVAEEGKEGEADEPGLFRKEGA